MLNGVREFLGSGCHLDAVIPPAGWPELEYLTGDLNRMMLELQSFRAFQISRVMEEKNKAQALIDAIADGLLLMDDQGGLICANQIALDLLGIPGLSPGAVLPGAIKNAHFLPEFAALLSSAEQFIKSEITAGTCLSDGTQTAAPRHYRIMARRFLMPALKRRGCVVIMRDITNEKEHEKAKEAFFRMITHDMRSPLATIQGYAEIIMRKLGPSPGTETFFKNMFYSARRLGGTIDDIMNITRLQNGSLALVLSDISANNLITGISEEQKPATAPKQITVSCETPARALRFRGDAALLQRVLSNLAVSAIRSTPKGGAITFGADQDAENVIFRVRYDGPALSAEKCRTLFDGYPLTGKHGGLGHLAMCKMLVELHNGRIWAESEAGGNKFIFTVPKTPALQPATDNSKN
jgi:signal transduction histidine kinase